MQIVVHRRSGQDTKYLVQDLDRLLADQKTKPKFHVEIVVMAGTLALQFMQDDPDRAMRYLMEGIRASRNIKKASSKAKNLGLTQRLLDMLWMLAAGIRDDNQFEHWFKCVQELSSQEVRRWSEFEQADNASEVLCGGIWMRKADSSAETQAWSEVMNRLGRLRGWARAAGVISLVIHTTRCQIIVTAEYENDIEGAVSIARQTLTGYSGNANVQFWLSEITARQFYYQHRTTEALYWFEQAFSADSGAKLTARVNALLFAAAAAANLSSTVSFSYLNRAAR